MSPVVFFEQRFVYRFSKSKERFSSVVKPKYKLCYVGLNMIGVFIFFPLTSQKRIAKFIEDGIIVPIRAEMYEDILEEYYHTLLGSENSYVNPGDIDWLSSLEIREQGKVNYVAKLSEVTIQEIEKKCQKWQSWKRVRNDVDMSKKAMVDTVLCLGRGDVLKKEKIDSILKNIGLRR